MPTPESTILRDKIRSGEAECPAQCRHGWPDIWHVPGCPWQTALDNIYRIERKDERNGTTS